MFKELSIQMGKKIVEKPDKGNDESEESHKKTATKFAAENKVKPEEEEDDSNPSDTILSSAFQEFMKTNLQYKYSKWVRKEIQTTTFWKTFKKMTFFLGKTIEKASEQV